jgi:WD40 repeat protein
MQFFDGGRELLMTASSANVLTAWSSKGEPLLRQTLAAAVTAFAASRDGAIVACASADRAMPVWRLKDQTLLGTYRDAPFPVQQICFNADATLVLTLGWTTPPNEFNASSRFIRRVHLEVIEVSTLKKLYEADLGRQPGSVAISSDWRTLLLGDEDGRIDVWKLNQGRQVATLVGHQDRVGCVALSPDGRFATSGSRDVWVIFWGVPDEATSALKSQPPGKRPESE